MDRAVNEHDRRLCPCGCGHWYSETHGLDEDGEPHDPGEWIVVDDPCMARTALEQFLNEQKERPPGQMLYTRPWAEEDELTAAREESATHQPHHADHGGERPQQRADAAVAGEEEHQPGH